MKEVHKVMLSDKTSIFIKKVIALVTQIQVVIIYLTG